MDRRNRSGTKIAVAVLAVLIFSILGFGAVEIWSSTIVEVSVFTLFLLWFMFEDNPACVGNDSPSDNRRKMKYLFISLSLLLVYLFVQMLPLPSSILKYLSPHAYDLYAYYSVGKTPDMHVSLYAYKTEVEFIRVLTYAAFFVLIAFSMKDIPVIENVIKALSFFGFVLAFFAILQMATWNGKLYWFREITGSSPFGPFVNRNHYAGLIGMLTPLTLGLAFTRKSKEKQMLFGFFGLIMSVSLFLSLSRAGIMSFFAGIGSLSLFLSWSKIRSWKRWAVAAFLFVLCLYLLYVGIDPLIERFYKTDVTHEARTAVWGKTLFAFKDFFLTGSGLGTFVNVFPLYSSEPVESLYDHAHNDYLEYLLETGVIGFALLLFFFISFIRYVAAGGWSGKAGIIKISLLSSITTMTVHSAFDFNLHVPSNALMLSAIAGMSVAMSRIGHMRS